MGFAWCAFVFVFMVGGFCVVRPAERVWRRLKLYFGRRKVFEKCYQIRNEDLLLDMPFCFKGNAVLYTRSPLHEKHLITESTMHCVDELC